MRVWGMMTALVLAGPALGADGPMEAADQIVVTATRADGYRGAPSAAIKIVAPLRDVPQTIDIVSAALLRDQRALSLQDALRNVPGIGLSSGDGQRDQVSIRGFSAIADQYVDGFRDDALYFRDLSNIEQVEVIKGPAAVLYGRGSSGGLINRVRRKPGHDGAALVASYGTFDVKRLEGDLARAGDTVAGRVTGAVERSGNFRDQQFLRRQTVAPSLLLTPGPRTSLLVQADWLDDERVTDFGIPAFRGRPVDVPRATYYGAANARDVDTSRSKVWSASAVLRQRLGEAALRNAARVYDYRLARNNTLPGSVNEAARTVALNRTNLRRQEHGWVNQTELTHEVALAGTTHKLLWGVEVGRQVKDVLIRTRAGVATVDLFAPANPVLPLTLAVAPTSDSRSTFTTLGLYAQDLVDFGGGFKALLGLRFDRFAQRTRPRLPGQAELARTDTPFSPRAGLVWQPDATQSYYASWSRSFQPSGESFALAANNADIAPEKTVNYEVGAKYDLFGGRLGATAALFRLQRDGIKSTDPTTLRLIPIGTQRTDGVELTLAGDLGDGLSVTAGYAYLDAKVIRSLAVDAGQPVQGKRATITPRHSGNLWLAKRFGDRWGFGVGGNAVGGRFANPGNTVTLPGYVVADAMAWVRLGRLTAQLNAGNLFDRRFIISGHGTNPNLNLPGPPRTLLLTLRAAL